MGLYDHVTTCLQTKQKLFCFSAWLIAKPGTVQSCSSNKHVCLASNRCLSIHSNLLIIIPLQTPLEFESEYKQRLVTQDYQDTINSYLAYDATWALALALNRSLATLRNKCGVGVGGCGSDNSGMFIHNASDLFRLFHSNLQETDFLGVSVSIILYIYKLGTLFPHKRLTPVKGSQKRNKCPCLYLRKYVLGIITYTRHTWILSWHDTW